MIKVGGKVRSIKFPEVTGNLTVARIVTVKGVDMAEFVEGGSWAVDSLEIVSVDFSI